MKKIWIITLLMIIIFLATGSLAAADQMRSPNWSFTGISIVKNNPSLIHSTWEVFRPPYGSLDKIKLHRVVDKERKPRDRHKVIIILPGTWQAGGWSEISAPNINPYLFLAGNGYDVYTMDFRVSNIPDMDYAQFAQKGIDLSSTTDWTYGVFREDVKACVDKIKQITKVEKIFMGGFSRGASIMFVYANKYETDLAGLVSLDGVIKRFPPSGTPLSEPVYKMIIGLLKAGQLNIPGMGIAPWVVPLGTQNYASWKLAGVLPNSTTMVGGPLPVGFQSVSDFVADEAHNLWGPAVLTNYHSGNIDQDVLVKALNEFTRYYPAIQFLEDDQMMASLNVPYFDYDDNEIHLPAIAFVTNFTCPGYGPLYDGVPNLTKSQDVTINYLPNYGHMDIMFGKNVLTDVEKPLLEWLNRHVQLNAGITTHLEDFLKITDLFKN